MLTLVVRSRLRKLVNIIHLLQNLEQDLVRQICICVDFARILRQVTIRCLVKEN